MNLIKKIFLILFLINSFLSIRAQTEIIYDEFSRRIYANAGPDIKAYPNSTILLNAARSAHSRGEFLRYTWIFPPGFVRFDDYTYSPTDSISLYNQDSSINDSGSVIKSWRSITTRTKYIELELSDKGIGEKYPIILKVKDALGFTDLDTLYIEMLESPTTYRYNIDIDNQSAPNIEFNEKKSTKEFSKIKKIDDLISIQPINTRDLNRMQIDIINKIIYDQVINLSLFNILDPNRFIPDSINSQEMITKQKFVSDTLFTQRNRTISKKGDSKIDTVLSIMDTTINIDTLSYEVFVDTVFHYNFYCKTDSCAIENANMEGASYIISWKLNDFYELELYYYSIKTKKQINESFFWDITSLTLDPDAKIKLRYPSSLAIKNNNNLLVASGNKQKVYSINNKQQAMLILDGIHKGQKLKYPSGLDIDSQGNIYISDNDNQRVLSINENQIVNVFFSNKELKKSYGIGGVFSPTSIVVGDKDDINILNNNTGSVINIKSSNQVRILLKPGILPDASDIAIDKSGQLFIVSPILKQVFRVENDTTLIRVAGMEKGEPVVRNNVPATDSYLGYPNAIDFDDQNRLYISDKRFGLIRRVDLNGNIITLKGSSSKINNITFMRVSGGLNPNVYVTRDLQHEIQRIYLKENTFWRKDTVILSPIYKLSNDGIYGLEPDLRSGVNTILGHLIPKEKILFRDRIRNFNSFVKGSILKNKVSCLVLLILVNQIINPSGSGESGNSDYPPPWPYDS